MAPALPAGRGSLPPEATRFLQRARLLDATAQMVAENGYAAASIDAIRSRAGVSARTFYEHFESKEAAVTQAFDEAAAYALPRVLDAFEGEREWVAGLDAALSAYLAILDCDRAWTTLCLVELPGGVSGRRREAQRPVVEALAAPLGASDLAREAPVGRAQPRSAGTAAAERVLPAGAALPVEDTIAAVDGVLRARIQRGVAYLQGLRNELLALVLSPLVGPERVRGRLEREPELVTAVDPLAAARRMPVLVEGLPDTADELERALHAARDERDGPALWRAVLGFHDLRSRGHAFDWRLERLALDGFENASFFGMPVREMAGDVSGAASEWIVPSPAQRCLRFVAEHPGCSGEDVRQALGIAHLSQVSRLLASLRQEGLVTSLRGRGRANAWAITDAGEAALGGQK